MAMNSLEQFRRTLFVFGKHKQFSKLKMMTALKASSHQTENTFLFVFVFPLVRGSSEVTICKSLRKNNSIDLLASQFEICFSVYPLHCMQMQQKKYKFLILAH